MYFSRMSVCLCGAHKSAAKVRHFLDIRKYVRMTAIFFKLKKYFCNIEVAKTRKNLEKMLFRIIFVKNAILMQKVVEKFAKGKMFIVYLQRF